MKKVAKLVGVQPRTLARWIGLGNVRPSITIPSRNGRKYHRFTERDVEQVRRYKSTHYWESGRRRGRKLSLEIKQKIIQAVERGQTNTQISKRLGVNISTVGSIVHGEGGRARIQTESSIEKAQKNLLEQYRVLDQARLEHSFALESLIRCPGDALARSRVQKARQACERAYQAVKRADCSMISTLEKMLFRQEQAGTVTLLPRFPQTKMITVDS